MTKISRANKTATASRRIPRLAILALPALLMSAAVSSSDNPLYEGKQSSGSSPLYGERAHDTAPGTGGEEGSHEGSGAADGKYAQGGDYSSSRSNKPRRALLDPDSDDDSLPDGLAESR